MVKQLPEGDRKWIALILRPDANEYVKETKQRIEEMAQLFNSGDQGKEEYRKLEQLGDLLQEALKLVDRNPTEFAQLAGVDERQMFYAKTGLLRPEEFLEEGFLVKIDMGFKKYFGIDVRSSEEAKRLLTSG